MGLFIVLIFAVLAIILFKNNTESRENQETKDILKRRPDCDPYSQEYQDWANEYEESKLNKSIHHPSMKSDVFYQFLLNDLTFRYSCKNNNGAGTDVYYITRPQDKEKVANCFLINLNLTLENFNKVHTNLPRFVYDPSLLSFEESINYRGVVCKFFHHPLTPTGQTAKYPYSLLLGFGTSTNSSAGLYFDKFGNVVKGDLVFWHYKNCYVLKLTVYNKEFQVTQIQILDNGRKEKIFDIKED